MADRPRPTLDRERELAADADLVVGFDEVGRGALAGPVMVGVAALRSASLTDPASSVGVPDGVADSKLLTEHRREAIVDGLERWCAGYAVGQASNGEIDEWGISHALGVAALRALDRLERDLGVEGGRRVAGILDGPVDYITAALGTFDAPAVPVPARIVTVVKGDRRCALVSAAAVIAKVTRDRLMADLARSDPRYAPYGWERNKGYGTPAHRAAIAAHGPTDLHRLSWNLLGDG